MWWSKKEQPPPGSGAAEQSVGKSKKNGKRNRRNRKGADADDTSDGSSMCLAETHSGIEVHFPSGSKNGKTGAHVDRRGDKSYGIRDAPHIQTKGLNNGMGPFSSIDEVMAERRKVYRSQYAIQSWDSAAKSPLKQHHLESFVPRNHRVPLFGVTQTVNKPKISDSIALLRRFDVSSELRCLQEETSLLEVEITALKKDRSDIDNRSLRLAVRPETIMSMEVMYVDPSRRLIAEASSLSGKEKTTLQEKRGICLSVVIQNDKCRQAFLTKCGCKPAVVSQIDKKTRLPQPITLGPHSCRDGGAATTIQHISMLPDDSFFISRDNGKSFCQGRLPERLFRRVSSDKHTDTGQLLYVSTGPLGCYYAEFRSGDTVWGTASDSSEIDEFDSLCKEWSVSRVAFGPGIRIKDGTGRSHRASSWVVLSRDGRAAWKNVPSRLHHMLEDRMASQVAPIEVSLGHGDSYFVRFLDGTTDYCLPSHIASFIEKNKLDVTSISMHADMPNDFLIRHKLQKAMSV